MWLFWLLLAWVVVETALAVGIGAAIGVADRNTLAGAVRVHSNAITAGLRPLIGCRLVVDAPLPLAATVVPIRADLRSLNVAVAGAMLLGEALRQTDGWPAA